MQLGIEAIAGGIDHLDVELLESGQQQTQRGLLAGQQALGRRGSCRFKTHLQGVSDRQQFRAQLLDTGATRRLDIAGSPLAHVFHLGYRTQIAVPVIGGRGVGPAQRLTQFGNRISRWPCSPLPASAASAVGSWCSVSGMALLLKSANWQAQGKLADPRPPGQCGGSG